jgi:hypothetical protein
MNIEDVDEVDDNHELRWIVGQGLLDLAELDEIGDVALHQDVVGSVGVMLETADG